jgi:hypothetical protein
MKVKYVFSIIALLIAPTFCNSQPEEATGRDLLQECQVVQRQMNHADLQFDDYILVGHCLGYITGARETYALWSEYSRRSNGANPAPVCIPGKATNQELAMVALKYINGNPTKMHERYQLVLLYAFAESYPCR